MHGHVAQVVVVHLFYQYRGRGTSLCDLGNTTGTVDAVCSSAVGVAHVVQAPAGWVVDVGESRIVVGVVYRMSVGIGSRDHVSQQVVRGCGGSPIRMYL